MPDQHRFPPVEPVLQHLDLIIDEIDLGCGEIIEAELGDIPSVLGYEGDLNQVLLNLVDNAVRMGTANLSLSLDLDGEEVLGILKKKHKYLEVIILTGHGSKEDERVAMELGAFAYLQKPVDIDALSQTLKEANEKARMSANTRDGGGEDAR